MIKEYHDPKDTIEAALLQLSRYSAALVQIKRILFGVLPKLYNHDLYPAHVPCLI